MDKQNYTATITVDAKANELFESINDISKWWTEDITGNSQNPGDVFTVRFGDVHVSTQKIMELIPGQKITWLVTESNLNFIKNQDEWTNTTISFEIDVSDTGTKIKFTHIGLSPEVECYAGCSKGWDYYFKGSLFKLLTEGKGTPGSK